MEQFKKVVDNILGNCIRNSDPYSSVSLWMTDEQIRKGITQISMVVEEKNDLEDLCFQVIFVTHSLWLNHQSFFCLDCQIVLFAPVCFGTEAYRFLLYSTPGYVFRQEQ